ncbi:MAG: stage 0 sporulation family protein [Chloroflexi bacterium]|nr:stage 0 sporulation family protein [Chloroflexota bacterium]
MPDVVGIRFQRAGQVYYFEPNGLQLETGDRVVVRTERGLELGWVVISPQQVVAEEIKEELKPVLRLAEDKDLEQSVEFQSKTREAMARTAERVEKLQLPMKLLEARYTLDGSRLVISFSSEGRVDFRELVRDLASVLKTRVELRQVGPRDEAKICGGLGRCGRSICCSIYLGSYPHCSIRMAKEQDLPLNQMHLAGLCGRLRCCLGYEYETYLEARKTLPKVNKMVKTPMGFGKVTAVNPLKQTVQVRMETEVIVEFPGNQVSLAEGQQNDPAPQEK